jgi:hypothetical protein
MTTESSSTIILYDDQATLQTKATDLAKEINSNGTAQPLASFTPNTAAPVKKVRFVGGGREEGREGEGGGESFHPPFHVMHAHGLVLLPLFQSLDDYRYSKVTAQGDSSPSKR